tara:strand:+ start:71 stop:463 length:393 start_codon:yes stop_codon:yes gene_type:complete
MKTSELTDRALDWAVAKCEGIDYVEGDVRFRGAYARKYSTDWAQGGLIIERESIYVLRERAGFQGRRLWAATSGANKAIGLDEDAVKLYRDAFYFGSTPLIAAMRCYVASKLGGDIEIPLTLLGISRSKT